MPKPRKRHNGPTPKRWSRPMLPTEFTLVARGYQPKLRLLMPNADMMREALQLISDDCASEMVRHNYGPHDRYASYENDLDILASVVPDDKRWDSWRSYRKAMMSHAN